MAAADVVAGRLRDALARVVERGAGSCAGAREVFDAARDALASFERLPATGESLPVCGYFDDALRRAADRPLAEALVGASSRLRWRQNPNYVTAAPGRLPVNFLDRYGFAPLVGEVYSGLASDRGCALGLLLLGPDTTYPAHRHRADEVYYVIGGRARWWREAEEWVARGAGSFVHHVSDRPHATRTGAEPLLALYLWCGAIGVRATLDAEPDR